MEEKFEELRREFRALGDEPPKDVSVLEECLSVAQMMRLSTEELCNKWTSYALENKKSGAPETSVDVSLLRQHLLSLSDRKQREQQNTDLVQPMDIASEDSPFMTTDDFFNLQNYGVPDIPISMAKKKNETDTSRGNLVGGTSAKIHRGLAVIHELLSERVESDDTWVSRTDRGQVEVEHVFSDRQGGVETYEAVVPTQILKSRLEGHGEEHQYMFDEIPDMLENTRERVRRCESAFYRHLKARNLLMEDTRAGPEAFCQASPDPILAVGRIRVELERGSNTDGVQTRSRINAKSTLLESDEGNVVKLDLDQVSSGVALAPGMVVAVEGVNADGRKISVSALHDDTYQLGIGPSKEQPNDLMETIEGSGLVKTVVATGPFTTTESVAFKPLDDLLAQVRITKPAVVVLIGPFIAEAKLPALDKVKAKILPEELFTEVFLPKVRACLESLTDDGVSAKCFLVPHLDDSFSDFVVPQPPLDLSNAGDLGHTMAMDNIELLTNPSFITVGAGRGVNIGLTSLSILEDLSAECMILGPVEDRISALCTALVKQRSFYPLYPPSANVPIDTHGLHRLEFPAEQDLDIMVVPSRLKNFAKKVHRNVVCVNPGSICKYDRSGTYAEILVDPSSSSDRVRRVSVVHV
mmetsp:Transcript_38568/g.152178  ORF Transcript_38568/g.152178 Transcript_38568/m.152178 type:complete len:639 (-) Transcript_38568:2128-4044(-)